MFKVVEEKVIFWHRQCLVTCWGHFQDSDGGEILQAEQKMSNCVLKYLVHS